MSARRIALLAALVFAAIYLLLLGVRPLILPDEHRYAVIALEMLDRGDLVVPRLIGFRYFEKPAGGAHLVALAVEALGGNAFAYRLPSALATGAMALALGLAVGLATRRAALGGLAALALLTMLLPTIVGTTVILDAPFSGFVALSLVLAWIGLESPTRRWRLGLLALAGIAAGGAFLVKGPLAIVLAAMTIGPWLLWERRSRDLLLATWVPLLVAGLVVLPWGLAIHEREPQFWRTFIGVEHVQRFLAPDANQHREPWWYFIPVLLGAALPWTLAAPVALRGLFSGSGDGDRERSFIRFSLCWIALPFLFFSASSGKLATYLLPIIPPIAGLLAIGLVRAFEARPASGGRPSAAARVPGALLLLAAVATLPMLALGEPTLLWPQGGWWRGLLFAAALAWWGLLDLRAIREPEATSRVLWMGLSPVPMLACLPLLFPAALVADSKAPSGFIAAHRERLAEAQTILATEQVAIAIGCEIGRLDAIVALDPGELDNGLGHAEEAARLVDRDALVDRIASLRAIGPVLVVGLAHQLDPLLLPAIESGLLPTPQERVDGERLVIIEFGKASPLE